MSVLRQPPYKVFGLFDLHWGLAGIALAIPLFVLSAISNSFDDEINLIDKPVLMGVSMMIAAGMIYLLVIYSLRRAHYGRGILAWVVMLGLLIRFFMFPSTPILENDHYRYMWDGAVMAHGYSPWKYAPQEIQDQTAKKIPIKLKQLAQDSGPVIHRIGYPSIRTIYPLVTEAAFALAYFIKPWSMLSWRLILLVADLVTLYLLFTILRELKISYLGLVIYWWNPVLIKEIYNSGHMEVLIFPFLLGAFALMIRERYVAASGVLGLAVGVKFWPLLLIPLLLRPLLRDPKRLIGAGFLFVFVVFCMLLPQFVSGLDSKAGITAYSKTWEMNDALYMLLLWSFEWVIGLFQIYRFPVQTVTRVMVAALILFWTLWVARKKMRDPSETGFKFLLVIAALFLLSPTQFPWYYLWLLPFLSIHPRNSLLLLTVLIPLYYMRFYFSARALTQIHDNGIVWIQFVPVWCLIIWEWIKGRNYGVYA